MDADCVFCRIVAGELPAERVYEDEHTLAFMDIGPIAKGHALIIPKAHHPTIREAPPEVLASVMATVQRIVDAQFRALQPGGVNVTQANGAAAGQVVPHLHFHAIPRPEGSESFLRWKAGTYDSPEEMAAVAGTLRAAIDESVDGGH